MPVSRPFPDIVPLEGELGYAIDDTKPRHAPEQDESPLTRGPYPSPASRRLM
jgi:hypothetical protein